MKFKDTDYGDLTGETYDGDIYISGLGLTSLEGSPKVVKGGFDCKNNNLASLKGSPEIIEGGFDCSKNNLTSLYGAPKEAKKWFYCNDNNISSLKGAPKEVKGWFDCTNNELTSLEHLPFIDLQKLITDFSTEEIYVQLHESRPELFL